MSSKLFYSWVILTLKKAAWAPTVVFIGHLIAINIFKVYRHYPNFDIPMHFLGGFVIAYFFHHAFLLASRKKLLHSFHPLTHILLVFAFTSTTTIFWEFAEFLVDYLGSRRIQLGLEDTLFDMFLGILGGAIWLIIFQIFSSFKISNRI